MSQPIIQVKDLNLRTTFWNQHSQNESKDNPARQANCLAPASPAAGLKTRKFALKSG
jgi:hypothetical protein